MENTNVTTENNNVTTGNNDVTTENNNVTTSNNDSVFMRKFDELVTNEKVSNSEVLNMYDSLADNYQQHMDDINFSAPSIAAKYFAKHARRFGLGVDCEILDAGAGDGGVGQLLSKNYGFQKIDAIEPSTNMLAVAKQRNVYRNLFEGKVGGGHRVPVEDNRYDAAVVAGCVVRGHMPYDAFLEMIRVVKPGGIIVNVMREEFTWQHEECDVRKPFSQWELEGKWNVVEWAIPEQKYFNDQDGLVHVYRVC